MERVDILIVGGGIAGLATAAALRSSGRSVRLVERELHPGFHSSGRNAAIGRQLTGRPEHTALAIEGRNALAEAGLLDTRGGRLLAAEAPALDPLQAEAEAFGLEVHRHPGAGLPGLHAEAHLAIPSDGVIDTHGLLGHCARLAREAGATLTFGLGLRSLEPQADGLLATLDDGSTILASTLVNAAGAWAGELGRMAGGVDPAFRPLRRHLVWSDHAWHVEAPWAWWVDRPLYLRPESGGLLLCPCDEVEVTPPAPGQQPDTDPSVLPGLGKSLADLAPELVEAAVTRAWSGLRTFARDRKFVIGWDPVNPRIFWVAGLGGHGMTTGLAVGRLAAGLLLHPGSSPLDPARFA
ncbi:MAG TPA: FAD-dependent oxidoreductase [Holophagaceae bacterium]|nr:FAD-dependent oxidoreductase [Holophagaceae bacterium]